MVSETIDKGITLGYLMSMLSESIVDMEAYKLGIIDEDGKRIKAPTTSKEFAAYGPLEEYIIGIKQTLGNNLDLLHGAMSVNLESKVSLEEYSRICESTLNLKEEFSSIGKEFNRIVTSAYESGLSRASIEKLIVDSILEIE
jgi:hypothetical protein